MRDALRHLNPLRTLRLRLGLLVLAGVAALAFFLSGQFGARHTAAYQRAAQDQLRAIAVTWDDGFRGVDLDSPNRLQRRIEKLRADNETLHKISISWHGRRGKTLLVQSGHVHDPDGTKRDVSTGKVVPWKGSAPAPIDAGSYGYREVHGADKVHYGELNYPVKRHGRTVAAMELHYDLKKLDQALAADKRTVAVASTVAALGLGLLLNLLLGRAVLTPLRRLRQASRRIGSGEVETRLGWDREDEIGQLANDFDRMAAELQGVQAHLEGLALKDPLTGLLNHRAFQERVGQELRRAEREGYPVSVVALDVDNFKEINDRWGHAAGDEALRVLASSIGSELRPSDVCGRVGGDEFMLAIVRSRASEAEGVVERLRMKVASMQFGPAGQSLTISAGISEFPRHSLSQEELVHLADGAMYWAKSNGRNRSYVYSAESNFALSAQEAADRVAREGLINTVHALAKAVDAKDGYTHSHSHRVARYAATLAKRLDVDGERIELVRTAGVLHDVGKIGISDVLLLKPEPLTEEEFATMRRHSELGRDIIAGAGMQEIAECVLHLHECWDGSGYPAGLAGEDIPLESRILHVADALEAMTSSRVYRKALPVEAALAELERHAGVQFDPAIARAMVALVRAGEVVIGDSDPAETNGRGAAPIIAALGPLSAVGMGSAPARRDQPGEPELNGR
ncbi:MAG: diguanylate cyclase [Actinomycetota bacterium]|nr:diguanylate cyclase [Actinomycetota bacterium]